MTSTEPHIRAAEEAIHALRTALAGLGLYLPSLTLDPASCAREVPAPLIDLGRCDVPTARRLTEALLRSGSEAVVAGE
jgi:hypothetical protein